MPMPTTLKLVGRCRAPTGFFGLRSASLWGGDAGAALQLRSAWPRPTFASFASAAEAAAAAAPKRPVTPWVRFLADFRARHKDAKEPLGNKQVMVAAASEWKALSDAQKKPYEEQYEADKTAYADKLQAFKASPEGASTEKRDPQRPKAPTTAFLLFEQEFRASKGSALSVTEAATKAAEAWKTMAAAEREPYEKRYAEAKEEYAKQLQEYKDSGKDKAWRELKASAAPASSKAPKDTVEKALKKKEAAESKVAAQKQKIEELKAQIAALKAKK